MSVQQQTIPQSRSATFKLAVFFVPLVALGLAVMADKQPILAAAGAVALPVCFALLTWPEAATLAVSFILYTNAADVAVSFHGVPYFAGAAFVLLLGIPLAYYLALRRERLIVTPALPWVIAFGIILMVGGALSPYPDLAIREMLKFLAEGLAVYVLMTNAVRTPETLRRICWTLLAAGFLMSAIPLYQQATGNYKSNYGGFAQVSDASFNVDDGEGSSVRAQPRLTGPIGEKNRYAQIMLMLVPIGLFVGWGERRRGPRWLALFLAALIAAGMCLSFSRGAAVGVVGLVAVMLYMRYITRGQVVMLLMGMVLVIVAVPEYIGRIAQIEGVWGLISPEDATNARRPDGAIRGRYIEGMAAVKMFMDHPATGVGPGMYNMLFADYSEGIGREVKTSQREAHNLYLNIAAENGILGLICFLMIVYVTLRDLSRTRARLLDIDPRSAHLVTGLILAIVSYLITGMGLHFSFARFFWFMIALAGSASIVFAERTREAAKESAAIAVGD